VSLYPDCPGKKAVKSNGCISGGGGGGGM